MAPINSDPRFTVSATHESLENSRWLAPEITEPPRRGHVMVRESKAADVFAFGMLAVEIFTGEVPFVEQGEEAVVLQILKGGRPKMPEDAQEVGLTIEMWGLIESCWRQNPKKRPTIKNVVVRWKELIEHVNNRSDVVSGCVRIASFDPVPGYVHYYL